MTKVVHIRQQVADAVKIGRGTPWGNPFVMEAAHAGRCIRTLGGTYTTRLVASREAAVEAYRRELWAAIRNGRVSVFDLAELDDAVALECYCAPAACHGDVLARAAKWAAENYEVEIAKQIEAGHFIELVDDEALFTELPTAG